MAVNLTDGAIALLCSGDAQAANKKPVLQVADIRLVNTQQHNNNERYRLLLSDGCHFQQGMLATQRNDLVKSGRLHKGSVVQLAQFVCNVIQGRMIIVIIDLVVILENCDPIGEPKQYVHGGSSTAASALLAATSSGQSSMVNPTNIQCFSSTSVPNSRQNLDGTPGLNDKKWEHANGVSVTYGGNNAAHSHVKATNAYPWPPGPTHQQQLPNRGPVGKSETPPRVVPINALNPYQGRWTIKARVTAKGELRHYNNPRGDGKVFSFDLLDSDGGEIRATCFNAVADQFFAQIELGKVYLISKGTLKPAQKNFNHLPNNYEISLESTSTIQLCYEDDKSIPQQQFHFRSIADVEHMGSNTMVDVIGVVTFISPAASIMRKNGTETQKRTLHIRDMSGRSVELTLWGNFCNAEGKTLQNMSDSGASPVLALKSGRVSEFNGKALGTITLSQLFIEPDFPEACGLRQWFEREGCCTPSLSISSSMGRNDLKRKMIQQIKDEQLGTSEKPDWITVSATVSFIKVKNFCYAACPLMFGDRRCNKKVTNNGDGKWRCDRCDQSVDYCDYRYILQLQIQDHTGLTWVTAFQESGEDIMGVSAKDLYYLKYEDQDDEKFREMVQKVLFSGYVFKLKVKEETFNDEKRVKSTVVKAEKMGYSSESKLILDLMRTQKREDSVFSGLSTPGITGMKRAASSLSENCYGNGVDRESSCLQTTISGSVYNKTQGLPAGSNCLYYCAQCGGNDHLTENCYFLSNDPIGYGGMFVSANECSVQCFKCQQFGHIGRDCPLPGYGSNVAAVRYGGMSKRVGGF